MVELDQFKYTLNTYEKPLVEVRIHFDLANKEKRILGVERKMEEPDFWDKPGKSLRGNENLKDLKSDIETFQRR